MTPTQNNTLAKFDNNFGEIYFAGDVAQKINELGRASNGDKRLRSTRRAAYILGLIEYHASVITELCFAENPHCTVIPNSHVEDKSN